MSVKRGRWCIVGKIVELDGEPVLATAIKGQQGTDHMASMPIDAVAYAESCGCRWWYRRHDRDLTMQRIALDDLRRDGIAQRDRELYVRLDAMEPCDWQRWQYVERTVRLGEPVDEPEPEPTQLSLLEVAAHG